MAKPEPEFTADECEELFNVPKYVASRIAWKETNKNSYVFRAKVLTSTGKALDLFGYWKWNIKHNRAHWGFSLRHRGNLIRSFDRASYHRNAGVGGKVRGQHKHRFASSRIERFAYKPDQLLSEADAHRCLFDFLTEAHVELPKNYQFFMFTEQPLLIQ